MPGHLFASYFLNEGIRDTPEWKASVADPERFAAFADGVRGRYEALSGTADPNEAVTEQELVRPVLELLGMGRLPAAAGRGPQRGHPRSAAVPGRRLQGARRREAHTPGGAVRGTRSSWRRASASACRSTPATRTDEGRSRTPHGQILRYLSTAEVAVGEPDTLGHPDERRRVAPVRLPRPPARLRVLRDRPRRGAAARQRGRPAPLLPAAAPELLHASARRRRQLPGDGAVGGPAPRAAGRPGHLRHGVRAGLPRPRAGRWPPPRTTIFRRCARLP